MLSEVKGNVLVIKYSETEPVEWKYKQEQTNFRTDKSNI